MHSSYVIGGILKKTIILILVITFIFFLVSGHYDAKSLESYHYVIAIALDKGDTASLKLSVQIAISNSERRFFFTIYQRIYFFSRL